MKKIVILSNHHSYTYNFRKEIIQALIDKGHKVWIVLPYGEKVEQLKEMGCKFIDVPLDRRGKNPFKDLNLFFKYIKILNDIKPDMVLTYTIKPNLYGGIICSALGIPYIANITGLSSAIEGKRMMENIASLFYKIAFRKITRIFCQNTENMQYFIDKNINANKLKLIPGSGVNLEYFNLLEYPPNNKLEFVFISRIMKEKGIDQYLETAEYITNKYSDITFHVLGFCEEAYEDRLKIMQDKGIIKYQGMQDDVREFHKISHCTIHPTYYPEGISNVLLESAACGRPIITTDRSGCKETINNGVTGFIIKEKNTLDLINKVEKFIKLTYMEKIEMGLNGRVKVEKEFDRQIVVNNYLEEIETILK